jgi:DNA-binding NarL/FixJ family response regulator
MTDEAGAPAVRVLVVDDHADVRFLVRVVLSDAGLEVVGEAGTAAEAVEALELADPDVVVLDALMPVVDGFEAAGMLLERRPELPILLCSGVVDDEIRRRAFDTGIAACLPKDEVDRIPAALLDLVGRG